MTEPKEYVGSRVDDDDGSLIIRLSRDALERETLRDLKQFCGDCIKMMRNPLGSIR